MLQNSACEEGELYHIRTAEDQMQCLGVLLANTCALEHLEPCPIQVTVEPTSGTNSEATNVGDTNTDATSAISPLPAATDTSAKDFITDNQQTIIMGSIIPKITIC